VRSKAGVNNCTRPSLRLTSCAFTADMARSARLASPAPDITAQDWAIESILHSSLATEPKGVPSS
jgi:hypothetical protein